MSALIYPIISNIQKYVWVSLLMVPCPKLL